MTRIEELLSRALLVRERTVVRESVPCPAPTAARTRPTGNPAQDSTPNAAAQDLRALCETLALHTPPTTVTKFVTGQVPEPRSALVLACVLQLTDTVEGARFWWQYAAGAGQAAAYCLYLHHLALGERTTAERWHQQTDDVQPAPEPPAWDDGTSWNPADHRITSATTTQFMRILRHLAKQTVRSRPAAVSKLMAYLPAAVTAGYLREPDTELPLPGDEFARRINRLLAVTDRPHTWQRRPKHPAADNHEPTTTEPVERAYLQTVPEQMGTAKR
ncbi:hypothetical protein GCM10010377_73030 [Streptomyces viridiviolaceus]|uniref:Uncharacterized protein n=1 Tax=Streptomyces viridiviolaceus TaxID=68282 RepID=A0ABW2DWZ9_9ACTN|nr:hypothetical protein [Streptomyces viridiviolaceus]GHB71923.1 hypothetical protein GCM10010377_73030 [Streptomyces viridiviolaceus]